MLQKNLFNADPSGLWSVNPAVVHTAGQGDHAMPPRPHDATLAALRWWAEHLSSLSFVETPSYDGIEQHLQLALREERAEAERAAARAHAHAEAEEARANVQAQAAMAVCRGAPSAAAVPATAVVGKRAWRSIASSNEACAHFPPRVYAPIALCPGDLGATPSAGLRMWANQACGSVDSFSVAKIEMLQQRVRASDAASSAASGAASGAAARTGPRVDEAQEGALDLLALPGTSVAARVRLALVAHRLELIARGTAERDADLAAERERLARAAQLAALAPKKGPSLPTIEAFAKAPRSLAKRARVG